MKIQDEFIPYSEALTLKDLGFDESCFNEYFRSGNLRYKEVVYSKDMRNITSSTLTNSELNTLDIITAPLYQQAFRWFREKYKLFVTIPRSTRSETFAYLIATENEGWFMQKDRFSTYEKAELECLKKLIEIVKNK